MEKGGDKSGPKFSDKEREYHLAEVARLYLQGKYQSEIAIAVGVSQPQVSLYLTELQRRWRESALRDFDTIKQEQLAKLDNMERELWAAWERSKLDKETIFSEKVDTRPAVSVFPSVIQGDEPYEDEAEEPVDKPEGEHEAMTTFTSKKPPQIRTKSYTRKEGQTGNPAYMDALLKCVERRCKLMGVDAPQVLNISDITSDEKPVMDAIEQLGSVLKSASAAERASMVHNYEDYVAARTQLQSVLLTVGKPKPKKRETK